VLAGRPNVGKSSLINALVGYSRSIVYAEPGTTRDVVTAETAFDGWPVRLADTAGLRDDADTIEREGIRLARDRLAEADLRILLFDTSRPPHDEDFRLLSDWADAIRVAHKCDLNSVWSERELPDGSLRVSSLTGEGVDALAEVLVRALIPEVPRAGTPIPITERQVSLIARARRAAADGDEEGFRAALQDCLS
jgi:tRNA modification GTPase